MEKNNIPIDKINEKVFVDIPSSIPEIKFPLPYVGVINRPHYIKVKDPITGEITNLFTETKILFDLPSEQRGLHMSRIEECLKSMRDGEVFSLTVYAMRLAKLLINTQKRENCKIELKSHYEKIISKNPSEKESFELLKLHTIVETVQNKLNLKVGVSVTFINACPCTQRWEMRDFYNTLKEKEYEDKEIIDLISSAPLQAHTNGGIATIIIENNEINHKEIYDSLDKSVPIIRELLKGMDEHSIVRNAHKKGQFCEDNIRSIIKRIVEDYGRKLKDETMIEIKVEVNESVHFHNLYSEIKDSLGNLRKNFNS